MNSARISKTTSLVKAKPCYRSETTSEVLFGESVQLLAAESRQCETSCCSTLWYQIKTVRGGYEGFVNVADCVSAEVDTTHWVSIRASCVFELASIKAAVIRRLLYGSELVVTEASDNGQFLKLHEGGYIWAGHCLKIGVPLQWTMIEIAQEYYLNAPYLWGGRSTDGCDCSGLVQMVALGCGVDLPRDSVDQEQALTADIKFQKRAAVDLVYWPSHVGLLNSPDLLLHATAHSMRCCIEPLQQVIDRAGPPSSIKRIN